MALEPPALRLESGGDPLAGSGGASRSSMLQVEDECGAEETTPPRYDIMYMPADYTLGTLYDMWKSGAIAVPEFQRGYVWTPTQASRLIESFVMDLPVPPVYLMMDNDQKALVIDGMQRLMTIFYFFDGCYGKGEWQETERVFKIVGISRDNEIYGKSFADLLEPTRKRLKNHVLRCMLVRQTAPRIDSAAIYHIFERLNTGGTPLSTQEIRNSIYPGRLSGLLSDMNRDKDWRKILGKPRPHPRLGDVQLVLRCLALLHRGNEYRPPMKDFLSKFMSDMRNPSDDFVDGEKRRFGDVCRRITDLLGERPFHNRRGALRATLLDAAFVAFAQNAGGGGADMRARLKSLREDEGFVSASGVASGDAAAVKNRLSIAGRILFG